MEQVGGSCGVLPARHQQIHQLELIDLPEVDQLEAIFLVFLGVRPI